MTSKPFDVQDLGLLPYAQAWERQKELHAQVAQGARPQLLLLEHPPVLTLGRKAREGENIVVTQEYLQAQGISVFEVERGGDVTYHGPGQLVAYFIFPVGRRVRDFLRLLEDGVVATLHALDLPDARPNPGYAGVYVAGREINGRHYDQKICSIGVAVKRHVSLHGIGLNVCTNLAHFDLIVPCGLQGTRMTSIQREYDLRGLDRVITMQGAKAALVESYVKTFESYDYSLPTLE